MGQHSIYFPIGDHKLLTLFFHSAVRKLTMQELLQHHTLLPCVRHILQFDFRENPLNPQQKEVKTRLFLSARYGDSYANAVHICSEAATHTHTHARAHTHTHIHTHIRE